MLNGAAMLLKKDGKFVRRNGKLIRLKPNQQPEDCGCCNEEYVCYDDGVNPKECVKATGMEWEQDHKKYPSQKECEENCADCKDPFSDCGCSDAGPGWTDAEDRVEPDGSIYRTCCPPGTTFIGNDLCKCDDPNNCFYSSGTVNAAALFSELVACENGRCGPSIPGQVKSLENPLP